MYSLEVVNRKGVTVKCILCVQSFPDGVSLIFIIP